MRRAFPGKLLVVLAFLLLVNASDHVSASTSGVILYDHGFVKKVHWTEKGHFIPLNKTSTFTQNDSEVWAYATVLLYSANLTWNWYDPDGQLYRSVTDMVQCSVASCTFVSLLYLTNTAAVTRLGLWRLDLLVGGSLLYSDYFSLTPTITQQDRWNFVVVQSAPPRVHANLRVTIHPDNQSWRFYSLYMPYAVNVTAYDASSTEPLEVTIEMGNLSLVVVDLGAARTDGYTFVVSFDLVGELRTLNGWRGGSFALSWVDSPWRRFPYFEPVPETFNITLPLQATFVDAIGINVLTLNTRVTRGGRPSVYFSTTLPPGQRFGWTIVYRDFTWLLLNPNSISTTSTVGGFVFASQEPIPVLPLTLGSLSLWTAVMSVFLLTGSELLSPIYARTGILINRRRLRIVALILVVIFLATTAYQLIIAQNPGLIPAR